MKRIMILEKAKYIRKYRKGNKWIYIYDKPGQKKTALATVSHVVDGKKFETGTAVSFEFMRNPVGAPKPPPGDPYKQKIEPAGMFMVMKPSTQDAVLPGWTTGKISLKKPLVIKSDGVKWKSDLAAKYKKTGKALTAALKKDGYDGIVTVDYIRKGKPYTAEIIKL